MFTGTDIVKFFQENSALAVFLTVAIGFWIGKFRFGNFSLGIVTSVLLVGVVVGQMNIRIPEPAKTLFFLMFLFSIGYSVGPQFFRGLRKDGLPQVGFAVVVCVMCLLSVWGCAIVMGYDAAQAAGLLAGSQTMSAVIGAATDTIHELPGGRDTDLSVMPVCYAVTYIYGTAGSAWVLGTLGPRLLGGVAKVKQAAKQMESQMGDDMSLSPGFDPAARTIVFRAFSADNEWFEPGRTVREFEQYMAGQQKRIFVERLRQQGSVKDPSPKTVIRRGDEIVVSGRRRFVIEEETWIGREVEDKELVNFSVETLPVVVNKKGVAGKTVRALLKEKYMHGVSIRSIRRANVQIPVLGGGKLDAGDRIELVGRIQRRADREKQHDTRGNGNLPRRADFRMGVRHPDRQRTAEPDRQRGRVDRRADLRLAAGQASDAGRRARTGRLVHEQRRPERIHRHRRHHDRSELRPRVSGSGLEPVSGRSRRHDDSAGGGHFHREIPVPLQRGHRTRLRIGLAHDDGRSRRRRGNPREQRARDGLYDHLRHRQYAADYLGRGHRIAGRLTRP